MLSISFRVEFQLRLVRFDLCIAADDLMLELRDLFLDDAALALDRGQTALELMDLSLPDIANVGIGRPRAEVLRHHHCRGTRELGAQPFLPSGLLRNVVLQQETQRSQFLSLTARAGIDGPPVRDTRPGLFGQFLADEPFHLAAPLGLEFPGGRDPRGMISAAVLLDPLLAHGRDERRSTLLLGRY